MTQIKEDVINILEKFFGNVTGDLIENIYDEKNPKELLETANEMLTKIVGSKNAKKHLQPLHLKYKKILEEESK